MKKRNRYENRSGIENATLVYFVLIVLAGGLFLANRFFFSGNAAGEWLSIQTSALSKSLSGQVLGAFTDKPELPEQIQLPILMYHHVGYIPEGAKNDQLRTNLTVTPE